MVLSKLYSNAFMSSLNSRTGFYEGPSKSDSREENHMTTGRFHATQFTSVGIPVTDDSESVNGRDEPSTDLVSLQFVHHASRNGDWLTRKI